MTSKALLSTIVAVLFASLPASAAAEDAGLQKTLITNVRVFDGVSNELRDLDVLVSGNLIEAVEKNLRAPESAVVIDGGGRTLMPGIIEGHGHLMLAVDATSWFNTHDVFYIGAAAAAEAENYLMRGWTTVRDIGGPVEGVRRAIEDGRIVGPRIYGSGPIVGQTSGHGDFRQNNDPHPNMVDYKQPFYDHFSFIADGPVAGVAVAVEKDGDLVLAKGYGYAELEHSVPMTTDQASRGVTAGPLYEYACHEGNYALPNVLRGARLAEKLETDS